MSGEDEETRRDAPPFAFEDVWPEDEPLPLTDAECARLVRGDPVRRRGTLGQRCACRATTSWRAAGCTPGAAEAGVVPDADARRALLLILGVLERHGRALRTLLARAGGPDLEGVLAAFEGRERALGEAARQLRARAARETAGPDRRGGGADGAARQGVLPLLEPTDATDADAAAGVIPRAVEDRSERLGTNGAVAPTQAG